MSITTKTGDTGETRLLPLARHQRRDLRIECLGTVDEAVAFLGVACSKGRGYAEKCLRLIQAGFSVLAELSTTRGSCRPKGWSATPKRPSLRRSSSR